jgi:hypothetical protein
LLQPTNFFLQAANQSSSAISALWPSLAQWPSAHLGPIPFLPSPSSIRHQMSPPPARPSSDHLHGNQASLSPSPHKTGVAAPAPPLPSEPTALKAHKPPPAVLSPAPPRLPVLHSIKGAESLLVQPRVHFYQKLLSPFVIPRSEKEGMKPLYVCPGCSNHTYSNNMITRFHVQ